MSVSLKQRLMKQPIQLFYRPARQWRCDPVHEGRHHGNSHVLVVNKADQKMPALAQNDLRIATAFCEAHLNGWGLKVVMTSAQDGWGQKELVEG